MYMQEYVPSLLTNVIPKIRRSLGHTICEAGLAMHKDGKLSDNGRTRQKYCCPFRRSKTASSYNNKCKLEITISSFPHKVLNWWLAFRPGIGLNGISAMKRKTDVVSRAANPTPNSWYNRLFLLKHVRCSHIRDIMSLKTAGTRSMPPSCARLSNFFGKSVPLNRKLTANT